MKKKYMSIALAYTGVIVGAGLSSGQDLLQYFLCFGIPGIFGVVLMGILNIIFGRIIVTLGCYYQSDNHQDVLSRIAHPVANRIIDLTLIISSFVMGFVMVAGAGSNLNQQFGLPVWAGSLLCSALIILVAFLDFDRITAVLGIFTPVVVVLLLMITMYTLLHGNFDVQAMSAAASTIRPAMPNVVLSVFNYFSLCLLTGVSMAFVLGGSVVRIGVAEKGGAIGGSIVGLIMICASISLFGYMDVVKDADIPMLLIVEKIHPFLGLVYCMVIFALIFNTGFSLYYATARRFSDGSLKRMRWIMILVTAGGYLCSFGGFRNLIGWMYPFLGYMGMFLMVVLIVGWVREKDNIIREKFIRRKMIRLMVRKHDDSLPYSEKDRHVYHRLADISAADNEGIMKKIYHLAGKIVEKKDQPLDYVDEKLPFDNERIKQVIRENDPDGKQK